MLHSCPLGQLQKWEGNSTTVFSGVTFGKCAHAFETANIEGLLANMAPSTYPWCDGKYVGAAEVRIAASHA